MERFIVLECIFCIMADINQEIEKIKKLPPDKRLKALQEVRAKLKKELEKEQEDVEEATEELLEEAEQEIRIIEDIEKPRIQEIKREESEELEEKLQIQEKREEEFIRPRMQSQYEIRPTSPVDDFAYRTQKLYQEFKTTMEEGRPINPELRDNIQNLVANMYRKERDIESGRYNPDDATNTKFTEVEKAARSLRDKIIQYSRN